VGPENEDPRRDPEPVPGPEPLTGHYSYTQDPDGNPLTITITVTQQDSELQAIEATLALLHMLAYDTRVRALTYIRDRIESDPAVWGVAPERRSWRSPEERENVARTLAESDGHEWRLMNIERQSRYYRNADALLGVGLVVIPDGA
jgi:hypothetical protein